MSSRHRFIIILLTTLLSSCFATPKHIGDSIATADSTVFLSVLPDTLFGSTDAIEWKTIIYDSTSDATLHNLASLYSNTPGIFTFRGGAFRDAPFCGHVNGIPDTILVDWKFTTDYDGRITDYGVWGGGSGWTGQPLYVNWPDSIIDRFRNESPALTKHFDKEEIIIGSLASKIYFINFNTGDSSRRSLKTHNTIKGTVSLDPTLNGNLYVGQGIPCTRPFGAMTFNLFSHTMTHFFPQDKNAWRKWGAYDSSPIRVDRFLFLIGENGTMYKYLIEGDNLTLHSTLQFRKLHKSAAGMEASMSVLCNYGYVSDNHGSILCVNLNTMKPVWHYDNHDDSDGSPVLAIENGRPYLYSACEMDKQGIVGNCHFVKLDALNGSLKWEQIFSCRRGKMGGKKFDGGQFSTPLLGSGNCDSLVFTNIVTNNKPGLQGDFVALNRYDGSVAYSVHMNHYAWSSPVALINDQGQFFVFTADTKGRAYIIDGKSGDVLCQCAIGSNFESSPIVVGNSIVIGSRGRNIYKLTITNKNTE